MDRVTTREFPGKRPGFQQLQSTFNVPFAQAPATGLIGDGYRPRANLDSFKAHRLWRETAFAPSEPQVGASGPASTLITTTRHQIGNRWFATWASMFNVPFSQFTATALFGSEYLPRANLDSWKAHRLWRETAFPPSVFVPPGDFYQARASLESWRAWQMATETAFAPSVFVPPGDGFQPRANLDQWRTTQLARETAFFPSVFVPPGDSYQARASLDQWRAWQLARSDSQTTTPPQTIIFGDPYIPRANIESWRARQLAQETAFSPGHNIAWGDSFQAHAKFEMFNTPALQWWLRFASGASGPPTPPSPSTLRPMRTIAWFRNR